VKLIVQPAAEADIAHAAVWYDEQFPELRDRFLQAIRLGLRTVERQPLAYQRVFRNVRRLGVAAFPYGLFYVVADERAVVLACMHSIAIRTFGETVFADAIP
jgi:plasmid stabilization system protein ParE